jgi:protein TonB
MATAPDTPVFSPSDRFGLALFGSILTHMVIILGVTFTIPRVHSDGWATLEITLVQTRSAKAPDAPQFLAQANQDGGGDSDLKLTPRSPLPVLELSEKTNPLQSARARPQPKTAPVREVNDLLTDEEARKKIAKRDPRQEQKNPAPRSDEPGQAEHSALQQERARLSAEISRSWQEYQKRPQRKFINARTQEYKFAVYMDAWRAKVERIGNLNYPEQARRQRLAGSLMLDVALNADGSVNAVVVRRSSGHKLLDDAAVRIVEMAAPFPPFPPEIRSDTDILHIVRSWKFNEQLLTSSE